MLEPTRRGRFADIGDWQRQYAALLTTAEEAAACVRDGDVLVMSASANWPYAFDEALTKHLRAMGGRVEVNGLFLPLDTCLMAAENKDLVTFHSNFFSGERVLAPQGNIQFVPTHLSATGDWQASRHPRVAVITCSAPNEQGWMSRSLWGSDVSRQALEQAEVVIVEVNDQLPFFASDGEAHMLFHVSEADMLLENSRPVAETPPVPTAEVDRVIAGHIAELVQDGACVQFGLGGLANAVGECLAYAGKKDLGIQTEVISSCVVDLMERGVINNSRKQTCTGRSAGAYFIGDRRLWDFARDNPAFCQKEIHWTNDARNIARNDNVVSINNAMEIDLTGQVNAESIGPRQYSGTGGQLECCLLYTSPSPRDS